MKVSSYKFDINEVEIDESWNLPAAREERIHQIHAYPAKFPAFLTTNAVEYGGKRGVKINTIGDIFCGCGTTAYESKKLQKNFWGCDINPVATLIAKVKSNSYQLPKLRTQFRKIELTYHDYIDSEFNLDDVNDRIKYWYDSHTIRDLDRLKASIYECVKSKGKYQDFFLCAFSNILKPTSRWLTKSIKPQIDPEKQQVAVFATFKGQVEKMLKAFEASEAKRDTKIKIETQNFLRKKTDTPFIDILVTSPPYVTSYEYADLHQLSTLWLDYAKDYKKLRYGTIGSIHNYQDFTQDIKQLNNTGESIVFRLYSKDKRRAKSAAKYYRDMQSTAHKVYNLIKPNGMVFFVIGNTEYKNVRINNAQHLVESLFDAGFENIEIIKRKVTGKILTPYRDKEGKFTTDKSCKKIYAEEFIVIGQKPT